MVLTPCEEGCSEPTWQDFKTQVGIVGGTWVGFLSCGMLYNLCNQRHEFACLNQFSYDVARAVTTNKWYLLVMALASMAICVLHVIYAQTGEVQVEMFERIVCAVHGLEIICLWLRVSSVSNQDLFDLAGGRLILDCMIVPTVLVRGMVVKSTLSFSYAASLRIYVLWNLWCRSSFSFIKVDPRFQLLTVILKLSSGIFFIGALIKQVETLQGDPWLQEGEWPPLEEASSPADEWTMSASAYLVLVTMSTVGYGDLTPKTILGQVLMIGIIVLGFIVSMYTMLGFMQAHRTATRGGGEYHIHARSRMRRHLVVTGSPSSQMLKDMVMEIYHEDHATEAEGLDVVIMLLPGQQRIMETLRTFLALKRNRRIQSRVWVIQGSPLQREDLIRVKLPDASLVYVLPNVHAADNEREDIENVMRSLSLHRHAPYVRMIVLLLKVEYRSLMLSVGVSAKDIVCIDELKLGLMGKSCEVQGFATVLCNFFRSSDDYEGNSDELGESWLPDYIRGMANEIYETKLSVAYIGAPFGEVAIDILKRSNGAAYLVGVIEESRYPGDAPIILLHPGRHYKVGAKDDMLCKGIFVANRMDSIVQHSPKKQFSWKFDGGGPAAPTAAGADVNLPNAVQDEPEHHQKWLRDPKEVKRQNNDRLALSMRSAASQRVFHGLMGEGMSQAEVEELLQEKLSHMVNEGKSSLVLEDELETETDPSKRAMLEQQLLVARASEDAKKSINTKAARGKENRARREAEIAVETAKKDLQKVRDRHQEQEQEYDNLLWGGPPTPLPPLWGDPEEPPPALLVKGGHVLFLALEGTSDESSSGNASEQKEGEQEPQRAGRKLGLEHFVESLRADQQHMIRPVVVLAQRVPYDWPKVAMYADVYLIAGRTLSAENLHRAGLLQAHAVVIHQRGPIVTMDPTLVDAQAIFACVLAESLLKIAGKEKIVMIDLMIDSNCTYVPLGGHNASKEAEIKPLEDDDDDNKMVVPDDEMDTLPYLMQPRFVTGQLFASGAVVTSLVANMLYNPSLGSLILEMLRVRFVVVPIPRDFRGRNYQDLYEFFLRRKNLIATALVRRMDEEVEDEMDEEQEAEKDPDLAAAEDPAKKKAKALPKAEPERWRHGEAPGKRFIYAMPTGDRLVSLRDGVLCIVPRGSRAILE